jgi:hypothetical protein
VQFLGAYFGVKIARYVGSIFSLMLKKKKKYFASIDIVYFHVEILNLRKSAPRSVQRDLGVLASINRTAHV